MSRSQVDKLGERLKTGAYPESDLRLLDEYRRSFGEAYEEVIRVLHGLGLGPTGRPAKSTQSIVDKLQRESIRLSQMQDVAGCRLVVRNIVEQDLLVESLRVAFPKASVVDRREKPSRGYRAVHVIAEASGKPIEIQVRTALQHLWAELSEKSSDVIDPTVKYGGGPAKWCGFLKLCSEAVVSYENCEKAHGQLIPLLQEYLGVVDELREEIKTMSARPQADEELREKKRKLDELTRDLRVSEEKEQKTRRELSDFWNVITYTLNSTASWLETQRQEE